MKKIILILVLIPCIANCQISVQMRTGYSFKTKDAIIASAVNFAAHGFAISPEMIVYTHTDAPACFGLKLSYEQVITNDISLQVGAGRYFDLYSTDWYDKYRNGWSNAYFLCLHKGNWFIEVEDKKQWQLSFGFKETICNLLK